MLQYVRHFGFRRDLFPEQRKAGAFKRFNKRSERTGKDD
jgi:hypothetical protein